MVSCLVYSRSICLQPTCGIEQQDVACTWPIWCLSRAFPIQITPGCHYAYPPNPLRLGQPGEQPTQVKAASYSWCRASCMLPRPIKSVSAMCAARSDERRQLLQLQRIGDVAPISPVGERPD